MHVGKSVRGFNKGQSEHEEALQEDTAQPKGKIGGL